MTLNSGSAPIWADDVIRSLPLFLSPSGAAAALGCSRRTVDRRIRARELEIVRNGRKVLIPRAALADFLARCA